MFIIPLAKATVARRGRGFKGARRRAEVESSGERTRPLARRVGSEATLQFPDVCFCCLRALFSNRGKGGPRARRPGSGAPRRRVSCPSPSGRPPPPSPRPDDQWKRTRSASARCRPRALPWSRPRPRLPPLPSPPQRCHPRRYCPGARSRAAHSGLGRGRVRRAGRQRVAGARAGVRGARGAGPPARAAAATTSAGAAGDGVECARTGAAAAGRRPRLIVRRTVHGSAERPRPGRSAAHRRRGGVCGAESAVRPSFARPGRGLCGSSASGAGVPSRELRLAHRPRPPQARPDANIGRPSNVKYGYKERKKKKL